MDDATTARAPAPAQDVVPQGELDAVRARRAQLRETLHDLERALETPISGREVVWGERVHAALVALADDFDAHVEVTEGPGGLHDSVLADSMRLAHAVAALSAEHAQVAPQLASLLADSEAPVTAAEAAGIRERATKLIGQLIRHRQRGADLVYEAYVTDIGGAD